MKFVHPGFLWALALLIVPIIIHLFSFRKYKTLYFSSLQFVQHIEKQNKSTQKLKNLLILICRLLALALIILAFAQPYFPKNSSVQAGNSSLLCIHIDNSFSMTMKGVEGELISEAKESAKQLINKAPLNTKILLSTNNLDGVESHITTKIEALDRIDKVKPSPLVRSYDEVVKWQKDNISNHTQSSRFASVQFVYLSDFQKNTNQFKLLKPDTVNNYIPIQFTSQNSENLSVDSVWFASPLHKVGVNNELFFKVTNHGKNDLQNVQLQFETGDIKRDLYIDIAHQNSTISSISFSPKKNGIQTGVLKVADKQFYADDDFYFTYNVVEKSAILVVNGEDANSNLANIYRLDNFYAVNEVSQNELIQSMLQGVNLVVLNGVNDIPTGFNSMLSEYANNGGAVAVFLGKNVKTNNVNPFLSKLGLPMVVKEIAQATRINKVNYKDAFFKGVFDKEKDQLSLPGVTKFYLVNENSSANAIGIVHLQNGKSLLYRTLKNQQAFLFTSVLQPEYGSFVSDILYTTIVLRMGELSLHNPPLSLTIGLTNNYPIYHKNSNDFPVVILGKSLEFIPMTIRKGAVTYIDLSGNEAVSNLTSGVYSLENNGNVIGQIALNYNRAESQIATWEKDAIANALKQAGIENVSYMNVDKGVHSVNLNIEKPYPYWKFFISFALLFLVAELLILKLWKNKIEN